MPNGTWKRSTSASRRAERKTTYLHVSVNVDHIKDPKTGVVTAVRTPKGQGATARRAGPKLTKRHGPKKDRIKGHDWPGHYGASAATEAMRRQRRNDRRRPVTVELVTI